MNNMTTPQAGHNSGNVPSPEVIQEVLAEQQAEILNRADTLVAALANVPEKIADQDTSGKAAEFVRQIAACAKRADTARTDAKAPYLEGGRAVDAFFKPVTAKLEDAKKTVNGRLTAYLREQERIAREKAEAEERAAREAEERARKEAEEAAAAAQTEEDLAEVERKRQAAEAAADVSRNAAAEAATASAGPVRGDYGGSSSLRKAWKGQIIDLNAIPLDRLRHHLPADAIEKAIRSFIKDGGRELPGVRIFEESTAVTR